MTQWGPMNWVQCSREITTTNNHDSLPTLPQVGFGTQEN